MQINKKKEQRGEGGKSERSEKLFNMTDASKVCQRPV
jgi:hypothetical protein